MDTQAEIRATVKLALPIALAQVALMTMGLVDAALVGAVSAQGLAAVAIGNSLFFATICPAMGVTFAVEPLASQAVGAGDEARAWQSFRAGLVACLLLSIPTMLVAIAMSFAIGPAGVDETIVPTARAFMFARLPGVPAWLLYMAAKAYLEARGITKPLLVGAWGTNVINFVVCGLLVFGDGALHKVGLPGIGLSAHGAVGAGFATSFANACIAGYALHAAYRARPAGATLLAPIRDEDREMVRKLLSVGVPIGFQMLTEVGVFALVSVLAGRLGAFPLAAHQIALGLASYTYMGVLGIAGATAVRVGRAIGAREEGGPRTAGLVGIGLVLVYMAGCALLFLALPLPLASLFSKDEKVLAIAVSLIRVAAFFQLADGLQGVAGGALRGAADTRFASWANVACHWFIGLPLAILFGFVLGHGAVGFWWGLLTGLFVVAAVLVLRFLRVTRGTIAALLRMSEAAGRRAPKRVQPRPGRATSNSRFPTLAVTPPPARPSTPSAAPVSSGATPIVPIVPPAATPLVPGAVPPPSAPPTAIDGVDTEPMIGGPNLPARALPAPLLSLGDSDDDPLPGSTVGEYILEERIGEGGFGAVYRAQHPMIGKLAAVKVLSAAFSSNAELSKRFINEARVVNRINHRNIVDIFSFGHLPDGRQYFVMEYLDGQSLGAYLAHRTKLPLEEALPIFRAVASAVDAAHEAGVVHRDLKPDNVFLARDGQGHTLVKLLDFGIAKIDQGPGVSNQTRPGQVLGTPSYMSPEQARGGKVDGRSDVYSFAALIHRTLAGRSLFFGLGAIDVALAHINEPPPRLSTAAKHLPPELDDPLQRALSKKPEDRPQTLGEVVTALTEAATAAGMTIPDELPKLTGFAPRHTTPRPAGPAKVPTPVPQHDPSADTVVANAPATVVDARPKAANAGASAKEKDNDARTGRTPPTPRTAGAHGLDQSVDSIPGERSSMPVIAIVSVVTIALAIAVTAGFRRERVDEGGTLDLASGVAAASSHFTPLPPPATTSAVAAPTPVVQITVLSRPPGAEVFQGEAPLGTAGTPFPLPRGTSSITLLVKASGHAPGELSLVPDRAREVEITLKKTAPASTATSAATTAAPATASAAPPATQPPATTTKARGWDLPSDLEPPQ